MFLQIHTYVHVVRGVICIVACVFIWGVKNYAKIKEQQTYLCTHSNNSNNNVIKSNACKCLVKAILFN